MELMTSMKLTIFCTYTVWFFTMSGKYILAASVATFGIAWVCDHYVSDKKIFGGKLWISVGIELCCAVAVSAVCNFKFFLQVLCVPQLQTRSGLKRPTRSFRHGLALLVHQLWWILLLARISLWSLVSLEFSCSLILN